MNQRASAKSSGGRTQETVFIVDPDPVQRDSVRELVESIQLAAVEFSSGVELLEAYDWTQPGCVVLELLLPDMSGLDLLRKLVTPPSDECWGTSISLTDRVPVIVVSANVDVRSAVEAMKIGAFHVLERPFQPHELMEQIARGTEQERERFERIRVEEATVRRLKELTPREREVLNLLLLGNTSKQISNSLDICIRTVDFHRRNLLMKMSVDNVLQLNQIVYNQRAKSNV
ncbi:MAG: response regulator transcription factor [Pirellula sp.]|jgi:FixJ family two-component response regulator